MIWIFISVLACITTIILGFCLWNTYQEKRKNTNELRRKYEQQLEKEFQEKRKLAEIDFQKYQQDLQSQIVVKQDEAERSIAQISATIDNTNKVMEQNKKAIQQQADVDIAEIKQNIENERRRQEESLKAWYDEQVKILDTQLSSLHETVEYYKTVVDDAAEAAQGIIGDSRAEIEDFQRKQNAINEEIRRREMEENEREAHQIILTQDNHDDIIFLLDLEDKIHNKDLLHKLIWSEYLQKPYNQMINKLFGTNIPKNVIYCIENIETHKKYIGKTTALVSDRWKEHIKTSLNIGTVAKQKIHDALFRNWDKFIFSIIEVTTKEKINEREKYYIDFYKTDVYGYNMKRGG